MTIQSLEQAANCVEACNTPQKAAFAAAVAERLRNNEIDIIGLESIARDARRQTEAINFINRTLTER